MQHTVACNGWLLTRLGHEGISCLGEMVDNNRVTAYERRLLMRDGTYKGLFTRGVLVRFLSYFSMQFLSRTNL